MSSIESEGAEWQLHKPSGREESRPARAGVWLAWVAEYRSVRKRQPTEPPFIHQKTGLCEPVGLDQRSIVRLRVTKM
ncbi:hypothetical protein XH97_20150 [Bradyrhizobium sp. CCBAU 53380]|nr:hypothetical protein [Bradyrhizobium sp. CCBAU 53380]